jgi:hypothetical protein
MNMFSNLMGGLIDKEQITHDTIQTTLENIAEELNCNWNEFFVMIKPTDNEFEMKFYIYQQATGEAPKFVREISLKEILGG